MSSDEEGIGSRHWTQRLFVDNAHLYLPFLEVAKPRAEAEVGVIAQQLRKIGVPDGARVLDAGCGIGRHSIPLASRGYEVVGLDFSPAYLEESRRAADEAGVDTRFIRGDMLDVASALGDEVPFQAVVNMFTSHGYHRKDDDLRFFRDLHGLSEPGAVLVIETLNRDYILRNFTPIGFEEAGSISRYDHRSFDLETSSVHSEWSFYERSGDNLRLRPRVDLELRAYSLHEMRELLARAGWEPVSSFTLTGDGTRAAPLRPDDFRMWVTAQRG